MLVCVDAVEDISRGKCLSTEKAPRRQPADIQVNDRDVNRRA